jgi:hypothetical protein
MIKVPMNPYNPAHPLACLGMALFVAHFLDADPQIWFDVRHREGLGGGTFFMDYLPAGLTLEGLVKWAGETGVGVDPSQPNCLCGEKGKCACGHDRGKHRGGSCRECGCSQFRRKKCPPLRCKIAPLVLTCRGKPLHINWWLNDFVSEVNPTLKLWGKPKSLGLMERARREALSCGDKSNILYERRKPKDGQSRFGFDPLSSPRKEAQGYSANAIRDNNPICPVTEFFGAIGLQRFRPLDRGAKKFSYALWETPFPLSYAPALFACCWGTGNDKEAYLQTFSFAVREVNDGGGKAFELAKSTSESEERWSP